MDPNQSETNTTVGMTDREIQALTRCYLALLSLFSDLVGIDPMKVSTNLSTRYPRLGSLHVQISEEIRCQESQQVNVEVLTNVQRNVGLMGFINALDECGYKTQATDVLRTSTKQTQYPPPCFGLSFPRTPMKLYIVVFQAKDHD